MCDDSFAASTTKFGNQSLLWSPADDPERVYTFIRKQTRFNKTDQKNYHYYVCQDCRLIRDKQVKDKVNIVSWSAPRITLTEDMKMVKSPTETLHLHMCARKTRDTVRECRKLDIYDEKASLGRRSGGSSPSTDAAPSPFLVASSPPPMVGIDWSSFASALLAQNNGNMSGFGNNEPVFRPIKQEVPDVMASITPTTTWFRAPAVSPALPASASEYGVQIGSAASPASSSASSSSGAVSSSSTSVAPSSSSSSPAASATSGFDSKAKSTSLTSDSESNSASSDSEAKPSSSSSDSAEPPRRKTSKRSLNQISEVLMKKRCEEHPLRTLYPTYDALLGFTVQLLKEREEIEAKKKMEESKKANKKPMEKRKTMDKKSREGKTMVEAGVMTMDKEKPVESQNNVDMDKLAHILPALKMFLANNMVQQQT
ncbi:unnamed protein product [Bursaphelenchus okinawaensis]|uniref:Uncharacterized protein n=1 Tax=Bursaphelenchus okinawaensis TaxID=465554 RepID=A0A811JX22_9BILA|nr:unnamed protein product [Bursaphelenchus okinawaensis]CAG9086174.1 unnamed protein product [Bursaphelenchus okinawaensis]